MLILPYMLRQKGGYVPRVQFRNWIPSLCYRSNHQIPAFPEGIQSKATKAHFCGTGCTSNTLLLVQGVTSRGMCARVPEHQITPPSPSGRQGPSVPEAEKENRLTTPIPGGPDWLCPMVMPLSAWLFWNLPRKESLLWVWVRYWMEDGGH